MKRLKHLTNIQLWLLFGLVFFGCVCVLLCGRDIFSGAVLYQQQMYRTISLIHTTIIASLYSSLSLTSSFICNRASGVIISLIRDNTQRSSLHSDLSAWGTFKNYNLKILIWIIVFIQMLTRTLNQTLVRLTLLASASDNLLVTWNC